jgi:predicted transcriptional regulator
MIYQDYIKVPSLAYQDRNDRVIEEIKVELALVRRDLVQRLSRIEEYMSFLESDVSRLRLDLQRFNDKIQEISEKPPSINIKPVVTSELITSSSELKSTKQETEILQANIQPPLPSTSLQPQQLVKSIERKEGLNQTEVAIIKYLIDNPGTKSATPIAQTVGKAREHIARTLKKLSDEKKIIRDETTWPYTYVVPDEIKKIVQSQTVATIS